MVKYVALAEGVKNRKLIPVSHNIRDYVDKKPDQDFYLSIYKYSDEHYNLFKEKRSLAGIRGIKTDKIVFDFDYEGDVDKARKDAVELCTRLIREGVEKDKIGIYFSGKKGFCIEVKTNHTFNRREFTNMVFNLAGDLKTFDPKIVDEQRIMRVPLTKHQDTKLFKIPLSLDQLTDTPVDYIKSMAKDLSEVDIEIMDQWVEIDLPESVLQLKNTDVTTEKMAEIDEDDLDFDITQINFKNCPKWLSPERYALQEGFFYGSESTAVGERNQAFMILAATYKHHGLNKKITLNMLEATADLQAARTGESPYTREKLQREVVDVVYSPDWHGGIYTSDDPLLVKTRNRFGLVDKPKDSDFIANIDMFQSFQDYATNIDSNTIKTGLPIDEDIRLTIGMPVALLGAPSSGKTTVALNILRNTSKQGIQSIFFSMDMHKALICQKQLHLLYSHSSDTIYRNILDDNWRERYSSRLEEEFGNVNYCTKAGLTIEDIRHQIHKKEQEIGKVKLVLIDYLECIRGPYSDPTTNTAVIADGIKNIAIEMDVCVILLVQPPKISGGAAFPLTNMYQIKGSSMVAQSMRSVIGIYREGFSPDTIENDNYITFVGLKNSMGNLFKRDCHWDGAKGKIRDLDTFEEAEFEEFRKQLEMVRKRDDI